MSIPVDLAELSAAVAKHPFGYLVTTGAHGHAHVVAVQPAVTGTRVVVEDLGRRSLKNLSTNPLVTLLWPPPEAGGYSLIVDGEAETNAEAGSTTIRPARAVLHRPAPNPEHDADGHACGHDCVELSVADH